MDYREAHQKMESGQAVESLVSHTVYEINNGTLTAEGIPVDYNYINKDEKEGSWQSVYLIESMAEFNALSENEKTAFLETAIKHFQYNEKYRNQ